MNEGMFLNFRQMRAASPQTVQAYRDLIRNFLKQHVNNVNWNGGPIADVVLGPLSHALASIDININEYLGSVDLVTGLTSGKYDPIIVDQKLAGYGISRKLARKASAFVVLIFDSDISFFMGNAVRFLTSVGGLSYLPKKAYFIQPSTGAGNYTSGAAIDDPSSIITLEPVGINRYRAIIEVQAEVEGPDYNLIGGTPLVMSPPHSNLVECYLANTATGGYEGETDSELIQFWNLLGFSPPTVATQNGISILMRRFEDPLSDFKIISNGHPALDRGKNIFGIALGKQDIYVKFRQPFPLELVKRSATLISKTGPVGTWQMILPSNEFPGLVGVYKVLSSGTPLNQSSFSFTVTSSAQMYGNFNVNVEDGPRAIGTSFCRFVVQFVDTSYNVSSVPLGTSRSYDIWLIRFPKVIKIQEIVSDSRVRNTYDDVLVRAAFPARVTNVQVTVTNTSGLNVSGSDVAAAVAEAINRYPISNVLELNKVERDSLKFLPSGIELQINSASATLYRRNLTQASVSGTSTLSFAQDLSLNIHRDTVAFYCDDSDVNVTMP